MKTIGVVGSRSRDTEQDFEIVKKKFMEVYAPGDIICSGLCSRGADRFAVIIADELNLPENERLWFPANWDKYKKAAGFIRNTDIARESAVLIACVADDRKGGTEDTVKKFIKFHGKENLILV